MKYAFTTQAKERVVIDRSLFNGKAKVYVDGKQVGPSHQGMRGAAGTFYPIKSGTLEIRSVIWELVPSVWYNENWVDLVPPLNLSQYLMVALPFLGTVVITFGQIAGLIIGILASVLSLVVMRSQRPVNQRMLLGLLIALLAPAVAIVAIIGMNMLLMNAK